MMPTTTTTTTTRSIMNVERAIELGEDHARDFAAFNIPFCGNECDGEVVTPENCRRIHFDQCMEASENSKQFTPFEFIASEFNKEENSEELWEAFENAVSETIQHDINQTEWEDYGVDVYSFPDYAAYYLQVGEIDDKGSELSNDERENLQQWIDELEGREWFMDTSNTHCTWMPVFGLACNCYHLLVAKYCAKQVSITEHSECFPETDEEDESDIEFYDSDIHRWFGK